MKGAKNKETITNELGKGTKQKVKQADKCKRSTDDGLSESQKVVLKMKEKMQSSSVFDKCSKEEHKKTATNNRNNNSIKSNIEFNIVDKTRPKPANPNKSFVPKYESFTPYNRRLKEFYSDNYDKYATDTTKNTSGALQSELKELNIPHKTMLQDPDMSLLERKLFNENPKLNKSKIKDLAESIQSQVDNNNVIKNLNRSFNEKDSSNINKWKSFQSNIFHDKNKKSVDFQNNTVNHRGGKSKYNTARNSNNTSIIESEEDNAQDIIYNLKGSLKKKQVNSNSNNNKENSNNNNTANNTTNNNNANNNTTREIDRVKKRWINGIDWKNFNTEVHFHEAKNNDNYSCKKMRQRDYQSNINEYETSKNTNNPSKSLLKGKGMNLFKRIMPYYTEVQKVESFNDINHKERKNIMKTVLEHDCGNEHQSAKMKKVYNTSVFQGSDFSKTHYDSKNSMKDSSKVILKNYEVTINESNNNTEGINQFKHLLSKSGLHYCDLSLSNTLNKQAKIQFKLRENNTSGKEQLSTKLESVKEKINKLGLELKEVSKAQSNAIRMSDVCPVSVRWDTKPITYNKKTLNTNFNKVEKGQFNKVSDGNTLGRKATNASGVKEVKEKREKKQSNLSTSVCSARV